MHKKLFLVCYITLLFLNRPETCPAQSLTGTTGLLTIPTAEMPEYREIAFGVNWLNKKYLLVSDNPNLYHGITPIVTLGYLPFLEISARTTRDLDSPRPQGIGDRMVVIRLRLLEENGRRPSVVFGVHDPFGNGNFNAIYIVGSKRFRLPYHTQLSLHLGYGTDWVKAINHQFAGVFGGISFSPRPSIALMLEYDAEKFNSGVRLTLFERLQLRVGLLNFDTLSGGVSYKFKL